MREHHSQSVKHDANRSAPAGEALELASRLQAELDELRQQLAWSNRLSQLGMLTAALAHELNNQLTPIRSYAQLALANPDNPNLTERAFKCAIAGSDKARSLIERVLELASPEHSQESPACQIGQVVEDAIACMLPTAKQFGVNLISHVEPSTVAIDALSLEQVLINLISNACQAMADREGRRQIVLKTSESNGRMAITVSDSGPGVPEPVREKLFEPFVTSGGPAPRSERQGTGLGLSICKQLITAAGGKIVLASSSEEGSTFQIDLPTEKITH